MKTKDILHGFDNKKVLVVGDLMIDRSVKGKSERISPEAPVPILRVEKEEFELGGASNVAKNIVSLGAEATVVGVVGKDKYASVMKDLLDKAKIKHHIIADRNQTTVKTRHYSGNYYLLRTDKEDTHEISAEVEDELFNKVKGQDYDIIIISDYAKGVVTERFIDLLKTLNKKIIMDPKPKKVEHYKNIDYITPNIDELGQIARYYGMLDSAENSDEYVKEALLFLKKKISVNVIATRSDKGMSFLEGDELINVAVIKGEVYDITGAGDSAIAAIALTLCTTNDLFSACKMGVSAGCSAVRHPGTVTVTKKKILDEIKNANSKKRL